MFGGILKAPDGSPMVGAIVAYNGAVGDGTKALEPFRKFAAVQMRTAVLATSQ